VNFFLGASSRIEIRLSSGIMKFMKREGDGVEAPPNFYVASFITTFAKSKQHEEGM